MAAFIALVWNTEERRQSRTVERIREKIARHASPWRPALDEPGLCAVWCPSSPHGADQIYPLSDGRGFALGKLFNRTDSENDNSDVSALRAVTFDRQLSAKVVADAGATMAHHFWGRYIAFLRDPGTDRRWILRDPTGAIPCYVMTVDGVDIYFARLSDFDEIEPQSLRINKEFLVCSIAFQHTYTSHTGFEGVFTLLPGQRVSYQNGAVRRDFFWNPLEFSKDGAKVSQAEAQCRTRHVVQTSIQAWAACFSRLSLQLSGGLDSSIIAACLASMSSRPTVTCIHFCRRGDSSDEIRFAREVAARCKFELLEIEEDTDAGSLSLVEPGERSVLPSEAVRSSSEWTEGWRRLAERNVSAHFRGDAGDELFYRGGRLYDSVDFVHCRGITPELWKIALNDAAIDRTSVWRVLRSAIWHRIASRSQTTRAMSLRDVGMLTEDAIQQARSSTEYAHPLFRALADCPPAKFDQAYSLLQFTMRPYPYPSGPNALPVFAPLLSQPLMELSLRTPLRILRADARDRSTARAAFADELPRSIINRRYKSLSVIPTDQWMASSLSRAREMLLDGYLANEGIVDRHRLESLLTKAGVSEHGLSAFLIALISIEVWIQATASPRTIAA